MSDERTCPECGGVGAGECVGGEPDERWHETCGKCGGSGTIVVLPADVDDGPTLAELPDAALEALERA